jgi:hypothetical protein
VAAVLHDGFLYFVPVGDSALSVRGGEIHMVNRPHVFANLLDQAADRVQISRSEAAQHPERESLTSFIGIHDLHEIDLNTEPWPVAAGETILLASDGLFKTLDPAEILECLSGHPQAWPKALVSRTLERQNPGQDNVSVFSVTLDSGSLGELIPALPAAFSILQRNRPSRPRQIGSSPRWSYCCWRPPRRVVVFFGALKYRLLFIRYLDKLTDHREMSRKTSGSWWRTPLVYLSADCRNMKIRFFLCWRWL